MPARPYNPGAGLDALFDMDEDFDIPHERSREPVHNQSRGSHEQSMDLTGDDYALDTFMQSQHAIELLDSPDSAGDDDHLADDEPFVRDDEELSDLDCFISIDQLLARGGDERRRVEFILRQFNKHTTSEGPAKPTVVRPATRDRAGGTGGGGFKSLGARRPRR